MLRFFAIVGLLFFGYDIALAAGADSPHLDGALVDIIWGLPFAGLLLSIALFPLIAPDFWHAHFGKIAAGWSALLLGPLFVVFGLSVFVFELLHIGLLEYIPFVILLFCLFTIAGGIRFKGKVFGTPSVNTLILAFGTFIASWAGTTGAAMLLIRLVLDANAKRTHKVHTVVFFIFLVANIGGSLTPIGDPPLFLGFLKGIDFFWPLQNMLWPMLLISVLLLGMFFLIDSWYFKKEKLQEDPDELNDNSLLNIRIEGGINFIFLMAVVLSVVLSGVWKPDISFVIYHVEVELQNIVRDVMLLLIAGLSWRLTPAYIHEANGFTWFPIVEIGKLFAGIFITVAPVIAMLRTGTEGALSGIITLINDKNGQPIDSVYFWVTGILSSFLDNAPTYIVFFNTAGGNPDVLMGPMASTLLAISCGAVFMGANTYIGNAPNFMVRSIAQERGVNMPSFFGYMLWSSILLLPLFGLITWIFF